MSINYEMPVLIVDDVEAMQEILCVVVKQAGFVNVETVATGRAAIERLKGKKYGLVIADLEMDGISGLDLLDFVRADEKLKHIRFIVVSAHKRSEYVREATVRGADCFMVKPFSPIHLQQKIEWVCAERPCFRPLIPSRTP